MSLDCPGNNEERITTDKTETKKREYGGQVEVMFH